MVSRIATAMRQMGSLRKDDDLVQKSFGAVSHYVDVDYANQLRAKSRHGGWLGD